MNWQLIIIVVILLALSVVAIAVKMFFKKGATFQKHCASKEAGKNDLCVCEGDKKICKYNNENKTFAKPTKQRKTKIKIN